jgi:hypothetical protein
MGRVCVSGTRSFWRECRCVGQGCQARREGYPAVAMTRSASLPTEVKDVLASFGVRRIIMAPYIRLNLSIRDVGTGMGDAEVSDLSAQLDLAALRDYYTAVGRRTLEVVRSLRPEALDELPDLERLRAAGVFRENAVRLIAERERETKGWWLGQLGIAHSQSHRGQAVTIRLLQGIRR